MPTSSQARPRPGCGAAPRKLVKWVCSRSGQGLRSRSSRARLGTTSHQPLPEPLFNPVGCVLLLLWKHLMLCVENGGAHRSQRHNILTRALAGTDVTRTAAQPLRPTGPMAQA